MTTWKEFTQQAPELAAFGAARFRNGVAYLGTLRADGSPRVHPVTPIIGEQLFLFMEPTSPKGKDLERDARYTLLCIDYRVCLYEHLYGWQAAPAPLAFISSSVC